MALRPGVFAPRDSKVRLTASPNKVVAGKTKRFTFVASTVVSGKQQRIAGASVNFGGTTSRPTRAAARASPSASRRPAAGARS